jgi:hypothetical protein
VPSPPVAEIAWSIAANAKCIPNRHCEFNDGQTGNGLRRNLQWRMRQLISKGIDAAAPSTCDRTAVSQEVAVDDCLASSLRRRIYRA